MTKKFPSIKNSLYPAGFIGLLLLLWQLACSLGLVEAFLLPSPVQVLRALAGDFPLLMTHAGVTFLEAAAGLLASIAFGVSAAVLMDRFTPLRLAVRPILILTQTVPAVALAPLLVIWLGFGLAPKILLVFITCFFPIAISTLSGLSAVDPDIINLYRSMGASKLQILLRVKLKASLDSFFTGLKLAAAYAIIGAVIAEWLGGLSGLGVYMTLVRKSYAVDKMFAVILLISAVSLLLMKLVDILNKKAMPWKGLNDD